MISLPLFQDDQSELAQRMRLYFHAWRDARAHQHVGERASRELREGSAKVYQEMWFAFADFCAVRTLSLENLSQDDIVAFLDLRARGGGNARMLPKGADLSPRYAWRMLTLIDRITRHAAQEDPRLANSSASDLLERPEYRYANAREKDPLPEYFLAPHAKQIIDYLMAIGEADDPQPWKEVRDRAAVALMLGAGLAPGDVRAATTDGVFAIGGKLPGVPWKIALPGNGNAPARETPIAEWAGKLLAHWIDVRSANGVPGTVLLPSTLSGKALSHATCYKVCKAVLNAAGMEEDAGGVFKLRHTFALRQLTDGRSESEVARWLGIIDLNGMARYRKIVKQPVDLI